DVRFRELWGIRFGSGDHLRDDLDQRNPRPVVVDERILRALDATGRATDVGELSGILLHVGSLDLDRERLAVRELPLDLAVERDRFVVLADLVVLGEVRVEVVLAGEPAGWRDLAAER